MITFNRYWAMQEDALRSLPDKLKAANQASEATDIKALSLDDFFNAPLSYERVGDKAVISLTGALAKDSDLMMALFGGTSTRDTKEIFQAALDDDAVSVIYIYIDSPGGEVSGTGDLADLIANSTKPTVAFISDLGASAAYWIAAQCDEVYANPTAQIGSIGVYCTLYDTSKLFEDAGVSVKLVKAGALKATGADGVPITSDQLADVQREIDDIYELFKGAVASGREMSNEAVSQVATGQVWIASKAKQLGLIDGITSFELLLNAGTQNTMGLFNNKSKAVEVKETPVAIQAPVEVKADEVKVIECVQPVDETPAVEAVKVEASAPVAEMVTVEKDKFEAALSAAIEAKALGVAEGKASEQARFKALSDLFVNDLAFAVEQFNKGNDSAAAAVEFVKNGKASTVSGAPAVSLRPVAKEKKNPFIAKMPA